MMQHPPDAVMHRPVAELLSPESRAFLADDVLNKENVAGRLQGDCQTYELVWQKSTGEPLPTMVSPQPIYENDTIAGSFAVITDITDIKKAEKEIRDYKEFLESVIDGSHDAIMITDSSGIILSANKALTMMLGLSKEEIVGSPPSAVFDPSCRRSVYNAVHEGFGIGYALFEAAHTKQDGTRVETENNFALIKDENGALIGGVVIMRDITERKKMQQKLLQSEKMRSLGQLAGGVAHDFNNVLTAIIGRVQLLLKALDGSTGRTSPNHNREKIREDMRVIEKAAMDGAETVRRIQQFSRRRDDEDYFSNADCNEIVKDAIAFTSVRWKGEAESQGITIRVQEDLAPLPAVACRVSELREVIINILNNAFDAMPEGGAVTVQTRSHKGRVFLDISDTGTGIPPEAQPRIFEPFFTTKGLRSTGLGMSISYGIIERHRGTLSVHETSPSGTTFRIELPASGKSDRPGTARDTAAYLPAGIRVLVIEDEEHIRDLLCEILEELGCAVTPAADGTKGMECFEAGTYDLVLTDLAMPGLTGFQVAQLIRKSSTPSIPIVLVTGWGTTIQESELHEYGISCTINKPFEIDQIHRVLGRILQQ
jgi:PAS domain S-box-containing protein